MRHVTFRQLQVFVAAAETLSFARAANQMHLTPAGISFQIKQIEGHAGFPLFERVGKRAALTEAGKALLAYAKQILQSLRDAEQTLAALKGLAGGEVTIGLVSTAKYLVPHILARFQAEYPGISIHLVERNRRGINDALLQGEIDLAVMGQPLPADDIVAEPFAPHPSVIVAAPSHPLAGSRSLPASVLAGEPMILREEGSGTRSLLERFFAARGLTPRIAMTTSSNETIKQAVMAGMGIALISRHTIGLELALGMLTTLPVEGFPLMRSWFVAHRRSMPLLPVHARLKAFLVESGKTIVDEIAQVHETGSAAMKRAAARRPSPARPSAG
jgi:LysR family transcriptional regulator, low CO2-responsive transcriptional regulator